ncbi:MAG: hypothetical protein RJB13_1908 [Pseudomonadota bacterium]|jgi:2-iminobutanoate/2-iminopropanoate deaminase
MQHNTIQTDTAPKAIGPYSQATVLEKMIFCSGQIPLNPETMEVVGSDARAQTEQVLRNLSEVLKSAGSDLSSVLKTTVFLKNFDDFQAMNAVYETFFTTTKPSRSTVEVARLPKDVLVEIECIAYQK